MKVLKLPFPKRYATTFGVRGNDVFPTDMLQHDDCAPIDAAGCVVIGDGYRSAERAVTLQHYSETPHWTPSAAEWLKHGWVVQ